MYVKVIVQTGARKEAITALSEDHFKISVKEEPVRNLANRRVIALLAAHFKIPANKVRIINGHHSPSKLLAVN
jgi:uncharacterized protein YggU (UPF0235/DUF167 family)